MRFDPILRSRSSARRARTCLIVTISFLLLPPSLRCADLPLLYDGCTLRVPAKVEGKKAYLIFDTGSTVSGLDRTTYLSQLGDPIAEVRASSISGLTAMNLYHCPQIIIGDLVAFFDKIAAVDLSRVDTISGSECDGILGADFAQRYVISINFDKQLFRIEDETEEKQPTDAFRIPLKPIGNGNLAVETIVEGVTVTLMIDTGDNGSISLNPDDWSRVVKAHPDADVHTILTAPISGPPIQSAAVRINDLTVGPNHYRGFVATALPNPQTPSTLGLRFLRQHIARFDFQKRELFLRSGSAFGERETLDMSGLHLIRRGGVTLVYAVDQGSPADAVGIRPGDELDMLNQVPAATLTMRDIRRILKSNDGNAVCLGIRRGAQFANEHLRLKKRL